MTADGKESADREESVLSRWSRRKLEARKQETGSDREPALETPEESKQPAENLAEAPREDQKPVLTDADMPAIDSLDENSDFSPFMSSGVSDELRNLALRKLFRAPVFNIRDGLDEYDDDFTSFEKLGDVVTCDMKHRIEMEQEKLREALAGQEAPADEDFAEDEARPARDEAQDDREVAADDAAGDPADGAQVAQIDREADAGEKGDER